MFEKFKNKLASERNEAAAQVQQPQQLSKQKIATPRKEQESHLGEVHHAPQPKAKQVKSLLGEINCQDAQERAERLSSTLTEMEKLPLWVQQVIYTDLKLHLEKNITMRTLASFTRENFLQLWTPNLTQKGIYTLQNHTSDVDKDVIQMLFSVKKYDNVAMMCARFEWSLQGACHALIKGLQQEYIEAPESKSLEASLRFLGDEIRIGEYLVLTERVNATELDQALQTQEYIESAMGERTRIADILVRLELVTHEDVESILFLKEESRKPFQLF